jgi:hypothetical protein
MGLQSRSVQKLLRESFPQSAPLQVEPEAREAVGAEIRSRLERLEGVDTRNYVWVREEQKTRFIASFTLVDPDPALRYWRRDSFRLVLDPAGRLTLEGDSAGETALVSDLDEIVRFARRCLERLERQRALRARSAKVRDLLAQGILAQVKKLAREERFDFLTESDSQKLKLYVRLSGEHALELHVPFQEFKTILPQLRSAIRALRELYGSGIRYHVVSRQAASWRKTWTTWESLEQESPGQGEEPRSGSPADGHSH